MVVDNRAVMVSDTLDTVSQNDEPTAQFKGRPTETDKGRASGNTHNHRSMDGMQKQAEGDRSRGDKAPVEMRGTAWL